MKKILATSLLATSLFFGNPSNAEELNNKNNKEPSVLIAAGDIASCQSQGDEKTANLLDELVEKYPQSVIAPLGDLVYHSGTYREFMNCFDSSWGRHKERMKPAVGNHEYKTLDASGYFGYFDEIAGNPSTGYYSYDLGDWHIVVLNSNCNTDEDNNLRCKKGSPQIQWLRSDLTENKRKCTLAYFHHPLFTSGNNFKKGEFLEPIWEYLTSYKVDAVLNGHDHSYERFSRMDKNGDLDEKYGIRQFVIGTGGANLTPFRDEIIHSNSEIRNDKSYGVLVLKLHEDSYDWEFVPTSKDGFKDSGTEKCR